MFENGGGGVALFVSYPLEEVSMGSSSKLLYELRRLRRDDRQAVLNQKCYPCRTRHQLSIGRDMVYDNFVEN